MSWLPHRYHMQFGAGAPPGPRNPEKRSFSRGQVNLRDTAKKFLAYRRAARASDQSVDTFMKRDETRDRFHYFGEGEKKP